VLRVSVNALTLGYDKPLLVSDEYFDAGFGAAKPLLSCQALRGAQAQPRPAPRVARAGISRRLGGAAPRAGAAPTSARSKGAAPPSRAKPGARADAPRRLQGDALLPLAAPQRLQGDALVPLAAPQGARAQDARTDAPRLQGAVPLSRSAPRVNTAAVEPPPPLTPLREQGGPEGAVCAAAAAVLAAIATARTLHKFPPGLGHAYRFSKETTLAEAAVAAVLAAVNTVRAAPAPPCPARSPVLPPLEQVLPRKVLARLRSAHRRGVWTQPIYHQLQREQYWAQQRAQEQPAPPCSLGYAACSLVGSACGGCADPAVEDLLSELLFAALDHFSGPISDPAASLAPTGPVPVPGGAAAGLCGLMGLATAAPVAAPVAGLAHSVQRLLAVGACLCADSALAAPAAADGAAAATTLGDTAAGLCSQEGVVAAGHVAAASADFANALAAPAAAWAGPQLLDEGDVAGAAAMLGDAAAGLCSQEGAVAAASVAAPVADLANGALDAPAAAVGAGAAALLGDAVAGLRSQKRVVAAGPVAATSADFADTALAMPVAQSGPGQPPFNAAVDALSSLGDAAADALLAGADSSDNAAADALSSLGDAISTGANLLDDTAGDALSAQEPPSASAPSQGLTPPPPPFLAQEPPSAQDQAQGSPAPSGQTQAQGAPRPAQGERAALRSALQAPPSSAQAPAQQGSPPSAPAQAQGLPRLAQGRMPLRLAQQGSQPSAQPQEHGSPRPAQDRMPSRSPWRKARRGRRRAARRRARYSAQRCDLRGRRRRARHTSPFFRTFTTQRTSASPRHHYSASRPELEPSATRRGGASRVTKPSVTRRGGASRVTR